MRETHVREMDLDVANIDKNKNKSLRIIYNAIDVSYFGEVKLFPKWFINHYKKHPNEPQNIPTDINNNIKNCIRRNFI